MSRYRVPDPLKVWVTTSNPVQGSQLQMGQSAGVTFTCGGPSGGYIVLIGSALMSGDSIEIRNGNPVQVDPNFWESAGATFRVFSKCDISLTRGLTVKEATPDVTHIAFFVWVDKGQTPDSHRPPDARFTEELN